MSGLILCRKEKAIKPYFIECIGKNVYTIEELCFFLYYHSHLLEEWTVDGTLVEWLKEEVSMPKLADELGIMLKRKESVTSIAVFILSSTDYRSENELKDYERELKALQNATPYNREKQRADYYVKTKNYHKAIWEYCRILKREKEMDEAFASDIYHNLGVAYGRMFDFEQSSECFLKAFQLNPNQKSLKQYKLAVRLSEKDITEAKATKEFPSAGTLDIQLDSEISQLENMNNTREILLHDIKELKQKNKVTEYYEQLEKMMHQLQDECRRYMNN